MNNVGTKKAARTLPSSTKGGMVIVSVRRGHLLLNVTIARPSESDMTRCAI